MIDPAGMAERMQASLASPDFIPIAIAVAVLAGAAHALAPGHGKTLAAAYLVASDGRARDALWLGGSVAVMHTVSCLVLALAWTFLSLSDLVRLERLTTGLELVGGLLVIVAGCWLLYRQLGRRDSGHGHGHDHGHGHGHGHGHIPQRRPGLVLLGVSGGLVPSPSAFVLMVTGLFTGRSALALVLVLCFGLGLAAVLTAVGLLAIGGRSAITRAAESGAVLRLTTRVLPVVAAAGITVAGLGVTSLAVVGLVGG